MSASSKSTETEHTPTEEADETAASVPEAPEATEEPQDSTGGDDVNLSREAAGYRRKLRDTETERDTLAEQVESLQRNLVEHLARTEHGLEQPAVLWKVGETVEPLKDADGNIDTEAVGEMVQRVTEDYGIGKRRAPKPDPNQGRMTGAPIPDKWTQAFTTQ